MEKKSKGISNSLSGKILIVSVLCLIIPMAIVFYYTTNYSTSTLEKQLEASIIDTANEKKTQIEKSFHELSMTAESIADQPFIVDYFRDIIDNDIYDKDSEIRIRKNLERRFAKGDGLFENILLLHEKIIVIDGIGGFSEGSPGIENKAQEDFYNEVMESKTSKVGIPMPSPSSGRPIVMVGAPGYAENGKSYAYLGLAISLESVSDELINTKSKNESNTYIINSDGMVLASEDKDMVLNFNLSEEEGDIKEFFNKMESEESGVGFFTLDNEKHIAAFSKCKDLDMIIVSFLPMSKYTSSLNSLKMGISIVTLISLVITILILIIVVRKISEPVSFASDYLTSIAEGDFSKEIPEKYKVKKDETGVLVAAMEEMQKSVKEIIQGIKKEADNLEISLNSVVSSMNDLNINMEEVTYTAEQMTATMQESVKNTEEMNISSQELGAAVEAIATKSLDGAMTASEISKRAESLSENAVSSQNTVSKVQQEVNADLKTAIEQANAVEKINVLTESILQITSQTNLLALNAAIEAARAGEAGKGFAVVADEIRKLAENSKDDVSEIQNVIKQVVSSVANLADNSKKVLGFIDTTVTEDYKMMINTGNQYFEDAKYIDDLVADFSATAEELSASIQNMMRAINEITHSNNESAIGIENIAQKASLTTQKTNDIVSAAVETKEISGRLKEIVSKFKV